MKNGKLIGLIGLVIVLAVVAVILFNGRDAKANKGGSTGNEPVVTQGAEQKARKYYFEHKGVEIAINDAAKPILEKLGEPMHYFEAPSCAFEGMDKIYSYSGFDLQTYTQEGKEYVFSVTFMDDSVSTREGISLNASLEDVTKAYGTDYKKEFEQYTYSDDNGKLSFLIENNAVAAIEYASFVDNTHE